ncbi:MAG: pyrroline-5-carboxylate reductase family protein, partial [Anaerovoracaceae bacterium]
MKKIGFIGMGNMAKALAAGFLATGKVRGEDMCAFAPNQDKLRQNAQSLGFLARPTALAVAEDSDLVIMACKPYQIEGVLAEPGVRDALSGKALVSVAIGWDWEKYAALVDPATRVQYVLPNTPAQVREGVFILEDKSSLTDEEQNWLEDLLGACGTVVKLPA